MATKKIMESPEFLYLPLGSIIVEEQIRSSAVKDGIWQPKNSVWKQSRQELFIQSPKRMKYWLSN
ncbi:MAG: hypothetical protein NT010_12160 [Proteobacteria bacterium]|nr:hypothetical protein [Pseudomonadota bacterium]